MKVLYLFALITTINLIIGCDRQGEVSRQKKYDAGSTSVSGVFDPTSAVLVEAPIAPTQKNEHYYADLAHKLTPSEIEQIKQKADSGDAESQLTMSFVYGMGVGASANFARAFELIQKSAQSGNALAQYMLGTLYTEGISKDVARREGKPEMKRDVSKGIDLLEKSAAQGNADALWYLGELYLDGKQVKKDETKAIQYWEQSASQGDAEKQLLLGNKYSGVQQYLKEPKIQVDFSRASEWYEKSAQKGNAEAQMRLATMYRNGVGVPKNTVKAIEWYRKAASQGDVPSLLSIAYFYKVGEGVAQNLVYSYAYYNLAASRDSAFSGIRQNVEAALNSSQRAEGQRLASNWKLGDLYLDGETSLATLRGTFQGGPLNKQSTGTAFTVSSEGHALTNHHVIDGCAEVRVAGREGVAKVITSDSVNDLALVQLPFKTNDYAHLNSDLGKIRQGEDIIVFGYPLNFVLSSGGNLTPGTVSALSGLGNNTNQIQITAPIQPGSSGSPVMDKEGNIVAIVSMKLDDSKMARATGSVGQNVNFATSGQTVKAFLDANSVPYKTGGGFFSREKSNADIAEEARKWTVLVECWK